MAKLDLSKIATDSATQMAWLSNLDASIGFNERIASSALRRRDNSGAKQRVIELLTDYVALVILADAGKSQRVRKFANRLKERIDVICKAMDVLRPPFISGTRAWPD